MQTCENSDMPLPRNNGKSKEKKEVEQVVLGLFEVEVEFKEEQEDEQVILGLLEVEMEFEEDEQVILGVLEVEVEFKEDVEDEQVVLDVLEVEVEFKEEEEDEHVVLDVLEVEVEFKEDEQVILDVLEVEVEFKDEQVILGVLEVEMEFKEEEENEQVILGLLEVEVEFRTPRARNMRLSPVVTPGWGSRTSDLSQAWLVISGREAPYMGFLTRAHFLTGPLIGVFPHSTQGNTLQRRGSSEINSLQGGFSTGVHWGGSLLRSSACAVSQDTWND